MDYEQKLKKFIEANNIQARHIHFDESVHSVEDACRATGATPDDFVKTICMIAPDGSTIAAIVPGSSRASTSKVAKALKIERPRVATPEEALDRTGYQVGGTPPFGYAATVLIDPIIQDREIVYAGGGTPQALIQISPQEIIAVSKGTIARVRK